MQTFEHAILPPRPQTLALAGVLSALLSIAGVVAATGLALFFVVS